MSLLSVVIMVGMVAAMSSSFTTGKSVIVKPGSVLTLKLDNPIVDRAGNDPFEQFKSFDFSGNGSAWGLNQLLRGIEAAATDANIVGIYLDVSKLQAGIATIEELRNALLQFKESGKFIISYADEYGQGAYYLASVADKIYLHPQGGISWQGLGAQVLFFKGALQKLDIEAEVIRHGKFKGAVEPFLYDKMSDENREQILTYANSIWKHWLKGVTAQRKISVNNQHNVAGNLLLSNARRCIELSFADELKYKDEVIEELALLTNQPSDKPRTVGIIDYAGSVKNVSYTGNKLAILYADGDIVMDGKQGIVGNTLAADIRKIRKDTTIKAVVFRINSPGGSALASDIIWREIDLLRQTRPVVVSMGDYAASGGYYIACPATKIVANPTTITGSIGVFSVLFNAQNAFKNKLGITADVALTEQSADLGSMFRPLTTGEKNYLQHAVEKVYSTFVGHVAAGRQLPVAAVDSVGQGRVWAGVDAKRIRLVDELGGLQDAIVLAADLAYLLDYKVQEYPKEKNSMEFVLDFLGSAKARLFASPAQQLLGNAFVRSLQQQHGTVQAKLPYEVSIQQ
ncbi:signal peptide peptidase SppA [Bacteroidia bacterium]|nr:signal peptide peptidase SppA [Bacteroidia bacterium]